MRLLIAGGMRLVTSRRGASLHVHVSSAPDSAGESLDNAASHETAVGPSEGAMQLEVMCKCLQISFWDDERRIILGPPTISAASQACEQEALSLYVDNLAASVTYSQPQGESSVHTSMSRFLMPRPEPWPRTLTFHCIRCSVLVDDGGMCLRNRRLENLHLQATLCQER